MDKLRVGQGYDVHAFVTGRALMIGGVEIPHEKGLAGHSDADVLLHAVMDALLGAAGLPDIGNQFPPSDEKYRDIDSRRLLREVYELIAEAGCKEVINIDAIIQAELPRMTPHIPKMKRVIADILHMSENRVNIKATTTEGLGFLGRREGIAASAVCLITCHG
ncbi:MAG: 2-C-methyl-D-erythritol 2,4-cyclodiphosphate synthase [candidate division Zixibacteria bacterium]|nr:2-C-methyl-D-erythritol 2,4-cyclodiphosphate synthase [candidate division Zixibacteria bacterium]